VVGPVLYEHLTSSNDGEWTDTGWPWSAAENLYITLRRSSTVVRFDGGKMSTSSSGKQCFPSEDKRRKMRKIKEDERPNQIRTRIQTAPAEKSFSRWLVLTEPAAEIMIFRVLFRSSERKRKERAIKSEPPACARPPGRPGGGGEEKRAIFIPSFLPFRRLGWSFSSLSAYHFVRSHPGKKAKKILFDFCRRRKVADLLSMKVMNHSSAPL
jgi:hypothetical protein